MPRPAPESSFVNAVKIDTDLPVPLRVTGRNAPRNVCNAQWGD